MLSVCDCIYGMYGMFDKIAFKSTIIEKLEMKVISSNTEL